MTERAGIKMHDISKRTPILKRSKTASHARASSAPTELCGLSATEAVGLMRQRRPQYARDEQERCVCRKPKRELLGDEVRQGYCVNL